MDPTGPCRKSGTETRYKYCPSCGHDKWAVSKNEETGAWTCYVCSAGGGGVVSDVDTMRRMMQPDQRTVWHEVPLPGWKELGRTAGKYLRERNILMPEKFGLVELCAATRIVVPYFGAMGQPIYWTTRYFMDDGMPKYVSAPGRKPLYVLPRWAPAPQSVIVEGPFDAMAVAEWPEKFNLDIDPEMGYNIIALGGKMLTKTNAQDLRELAPGAKTIMLDSDALVDAMKLKARLLNARVYQLPLGMDPGDIARS